MYCLFNRLANDFSRTGLLIFGLGIISFILTVIATYLAIFSFETVSTTPLDGKPPAEKLAFLRVIDPKESMIDDLESLDKGSDANAPGLDILFEHMGQDPRMVLVGSIGGLDSPASTTFLDQNALMMVGAQPVPISPDLEPGKINLWIGSDGDPKATGQTSVKGLPVLIRSERVLPFEYVQGTGYAHTSAGASIYAVTPADFDMLFDVTRLNPRTLLTTFSCYCDVSELQKTTDSMNLAEQEGQTGRFYYVLDYQNVRSEASLNQVSTTVWELVFSVTAIATFAGMVIMVGQRIWDHNTPGYRIDRLNGATQTALQVRFQVQMVIAFVLPAIAGFTLVNIGVGSSGFPPPLSTGHRLDRGRKFLCCATSCFIAGNSTD